MYVYWGEKSTEQKLLSFSQVSLSRLLDLIYVPTKKLSSYLKEYGSYGLHKISASGETST